MNAQSKILIADDEQVGRQLLEALLLSQGYALDFAANGAEALAKAINWVPDLILLDVMMPDMDGFEVCRQVRSHQSLAEIPIIMLTALDDKDSRLRGIEAGADEFISKPFDRTELRARVRTITRLNRYRGILAERSKFDRVVEFAPDGILIVDAQDTIRLSNPALHQMLLLPEGQSLVGNPASTLFAPEQCARIQADLRGILNEASKPIWMETLFVRADKQSIPVELTARCFPWEGQLALQINARDISEKKKLEAQFLRAQRMQSIGNLAGGIAHDLNNVLTPILSAIQLLRYKLPDESNRRLLDTLEASAERGAGIIKQILAFARGREGERKLLQMKYLVAELENIIRDTFPRSIQIRTSFGRELKPVLGDTTHLHQVLMNLCVNARDAMLPAGGLLKIEVENAVLTAEQARQYPDAAPGSYVMLAVSDTGTGIPPEILDKLFEPFFTTKEVGKGTGLGLSTVLGLVKSHGGFVTIDSQIGRGSCFRVFLPAAAQATDETVNQKPKEIPRGKGETVLVVDDESAIRDISRQTLERFGYAVITAANGIEAVAAYARQTNEIKLIVTDYVMPLLEGGTYLKILQQLNPDVPIIVVSGSFEKDKIHDLLNGERMTFIVKPFTAETLLLTMHEMLLAAYGSSSKPAVSSPKTPGSKTSFTSAKSKTAVPK